MVLSSDTYITKVNPGTVPSSIVNDASPSSFVSSTRRMSRVQPVSKTLFQDANNGVNKVSTTNMFSNQCQTCSSGKRSSPIVEISRNNDWKSWDIILQCLIQLSQARGLRSIWREPINRRKCMCQSPGISNNSLHVSFGCQVLNAGIAWVGQYFSKIKIVSFELISSQSVLKVLPVMWPAHYK